MTSENSQTLGKYRILGELGKGGFATVYRAKDMTLGREVALKILFPQLLSDEVFVRGFKQEGRTLAALLHPSIVTVYDSDEADGRLYLAMQLVNGPNLAQVIARRGHVPWSEMLELLKPIADALDYAHDQQVVHRDLKPSNILVDPRLGPLVSDFGFAQILSQSTMALSSSGGLLGTPGYIAPEMWDDNVATAQSDVYALGCIVYEMLTGAALFHGPTPIQILRAHDRGPQFPPSWPEDVPDGIDTVLKNALTRTPADRYPSAGALWHGLHDLDTAARHAQAAAVASWHNATVAAIKSEEWDIAHTALTHWLAIAPDDQAAHEAQATIEQGRQAAEAAQAIASSRSTTEAAIAAGEWEIAENALTHWLELAPDDRAAHQVQATIERHTVTSQLASEPKSASVTPPRPAPEPPVPAMSRSTDRAPSVVVRAHKPRRLPWIIAGFLIVAAIVGAFLVTRSLNSQSSNAIEGVQTFDNLSRDHVDGPITYAQIPPVGGAHNPDPLKCDVYTEPVPNERAVHSLEHGAVWITYQPDLTADQVGQLTSIVRGQSYLILSPYPGIPSPIVASAWGLQLKLDSADDPRLMLFIKAYRQGSQIPEPGGTC